MFSLTVRDHLMIAHSFSGERFGPARKMHGATYVVDVTFLRDELDDDDLVVDIGLASEQLKAVVTEFNLSNLDEHKEFSGRNTTTEFMARVIFDRMAERILAGQLGPEAEGLRRMKVTLAESHVAWAGYENEL
ncbi:MULTISPECIES: 6-pyruvoyl trahydropterin synthase family protein [Marinobacter]|uniref:6-pyruvoyl trahydropterin synthase family protein n=1 Tax=Marinobacter TaxID=2742 RepID=UPI000DAD1292|nr:MULTISPECIES: 6-carboxytetrahydropterin synthase [Marinobacter]